MTLDEVTRIVITLARAVEDPISLETLKLKTEELLQSPAFAEFKFDTVVNHARSMINVSARNDSEIVSDKGYVPWIATRFAEADKQYWKRYYIYLSEKKCLPETSLIKLDRSTDRILDLLHDPVGTQPWDRRGLVVGDVQSGKTANYTGLICKAIDAGFKLIIILAGAHKNLRSQTQIRMDEGVLGFDTRYAQNREQEGAIKTRIGVGELPPRFIDPVVNSLTTSMDDGDFDGSSIKGALVGIGGNPNILCIKKNVHILKNVITWLKTSAEKQHDGSYLIENIPLLLIDDEADYASVNTADYVDENGKVIEDRDPTAINSKIRDILKLFNQSAYVGYTATPFANIFIHNDTKEAIAGEDLFPRSFIRNIYSPSNYIGADRFFGLKNEEIEDKKKIAQINYTDDALGIFPPKHKKTLEIDRLPDSMLRSLEDFVLACAVRAARGQQNQHNSMLIHVTRFTDVQHQVFHLVEGLITGYLQSVRYDKGSNFRETLKIRYESTFAPKSKKAIEQLKIDDCVEVTWSQVNEKIVAVMEKINVREINGSAGDVLDYLEHPDGLNVIAIGGDKLSRGLTLEGLTVSYFLRASKMYDTLMQMGRWFGYRPGYADVCRLYTTMDLVDWYQHIARAMVELRDEFDHMASIGANPEQYGLRVATHPSGMVVTGPAKMRAASDHRIGYNNTTAISTTFDCDNRTIAKNFENVEHFIKTLGQSTFPKDGLCVWKDIPAESLLEFLQQHSVPPSVITTNTQLLAQYIAEMQKDENELTHWTVLLATNGEGKRPIEVADINVRPIRRRNIDTASSTDDPLYAAVDNSYTVKSVLSPTHEVIDLDDHQVRNARQKEDAYREREKLAPKKGTLPSGPYIRAERNAKNGLLILYLIEATNLELPIVGFVVSFPNSSNGHVINYKVNNVFNNNFIRDHLDVD